MTKRWRFENVLFRLFRCFRKDSFLERMDGPALPRAVASANKLARVHRETNRLVTVPLMSKRRPVARPLVLAH